MTPKDIKFREILHLRGPNMWTYRPVLQAIVDIGELEDFPSSKIPGYCERLKAMLPSLVEHRCSYGERGGFLRRVEEGTWPAHILEHVTLELQNLAGLPGGFGKARETAERGVYKVVVRAWQEEVTRAALHEARELILAAMEGRPFDAAAAVARIAELADSRCFGPSTASIVEAAEARGIPCIRLLETGNLAQLGHGAAMHRIWTAETDRTSAIAEGISRDKDLAKQLLQNAGVPTPEGRAAKSAQDAWKAAREIGLPVCVKPVDGNHGRGVFIDLSEREEIETAYGIASGEGSGVLVERFVPGSEHRLLVIGGKLVAANRGNAVKIVGDGEHAVRELVERQINSDPRRGPNESQPLSRIHMDSAARIELAHQKLDPDAVPETGREVLIQRNANHAIDVTDEVHPETAEIAVLAARVVGLDIAGIDLVCEDIARPLAGQGGAIVEINAGPGLLMHLKPAVGKPRPVGRAIVDHLFPDGATGRIPIVGVTGSRGETTVARLIARLLTLSGRHTGVACGEGLFFDHRLSEPGDCAHWEHARRVLMSRATEAAVFENGVDAMASEGLAYDRCQVGVLTHFDAARHLGRHHVETPEQVFDVLRTQVDVVLHEGAAVLGAHSPELVRIAKLCDGEVIYFARDPSLPVVAAHLAEGRRAVLAREGEILLASGADETPLARLEDVLPARDEASGAVENVLAAVGAAWALGLSLDVMRTGIETFFVE